MFSLLLHLLSFNCLQMVIKSVKDNSRAYGTIVAFERIGRIGLIDPSRDQLRLSAVHFIYCNLIFSMYMLVYVLNKWSVFLFLIVISLLILTLIVVANFSLFFSK